MPSLIYKSSLIYKCSRIKALIYVSSLFIKCRLLSKNTARCNGSQRLTSQLLVENIAKQWFLSS